MSDTDTKAERAQFTNGTSNDTHDTQDEGHEDPEPMDTQLGNSRDALEPHDWDELEERFTAKMKECQEREEELGREFAEWVEVRWGSRTRVLLSPSFFYPTMVGWLRFALLLPSGICAACMRKTPEANEGASGLFN